MRMAGCYLKRQGAEITLRFLQRKMAEYDRLREEIESLRVELGEAAGIKTEEAAS